MFFNKIRLSRDAKAQARVALNKLSDACSVTITIPTSDRDLLHTFYMRACNAADKIKELKADVKRLEGQQDILSKAKMYADDYISGISKISISNDMSFPDDVAVYVDDMLNDKKVIKQEATKCIRINKDHTVDNGYTSESPDKGYDYKLIRE